jgi:hypothetical protein
VSARTPAPPEGGTSLTVLAYNDLGMHCMNEGFADLVILPPYNTLRAQVIRRGDSPDILSGNDASVSYVIPSNTHSADKTDFWTYAEQIFGVPLPPDVGLTGHGLAGSMSSVPGKAYEVTGIPLTPIDDNGRLNPYPLAIVTATSEAGGVATTQAVVPVSTEIRCNLCHQSETMSPTMDVLAAHDSLHGTDLVNQRPVLCAACHADNALGAPGVPGLPSLSHAMHGAHADRMDKIDIDNTCYACHPGQRTQCQRDVHLAKGIECIACHGDMEAVGNPAREPWVDLPRCGDCHERPGFDFEEPGVLFKDSVGHGGVRCAACHGSPHAVGPTVTQTDNVQAILQQGHSGVINTCSVCHTQMPDKPFFHRRNDD